MRKYSVLAFLSLCALSVFWACGDGEFVGASDGDYLAIERYANVSADEIADVMGKCDGDKKCIEETMKNLQIVDAPDTTKKDSAASSSSAADTTKKDSLLSSSATADTTAKDTTATDSTASSASADTSAVSSSAVADSTASSSSVVAGSSSSADASSSSRGGRGSSDSADDESSSSEVDEGDEDVEKLPISGVCTASSPTVPLGGSVTWTYVPDEGSRTEGDIEWFDESANDATYKQLGASVTMTYEKRPDVNVGTKVHAVVEFDGVEINPGCPTVTIIQPEVEESSTSGGSGSDEGGDSGSGDGDSGNGETSEGGDSGTGDSGSGGSGGSGNSGSTECKTGIMLGGNNCPESGSGDSGNGESGGESGGETDGSGSGVSGSGSGESGSDAGETTVDPQTLELKDGVGSAYAAGKYLIKSNDCSKDYMIIQCAGSCSIYVDELEVYSGAEYEYSSSTKSSLFTKNSTMEITGDGVAVLGCRGY